MLLTDGRTQAPETAAYLLDHPVSERYAIGHPAAVADPGAIEISGGDRYDTAVHVAEQLLHSPDDGRVRVRAVVCRRPGRRGGDRRG